ncbi:DNA ligase domain protein [Mycobacterium kansasii]|uniref:DNA ligase domain protein n=1 Tax=Mycobacterium kansasii TaxID=1768 RepID=A0A1V3XS32_MYCKA|nr:DNA ligase domain protein [Mycobacterium kansasii]
MPVSEHTTLVNDMAGVQERIDYWASIATRWTTKSTAW